MDLSERQQALIARYIGFAQIQVHFVCGKLPYEREIVRICLELGVRRRAVWYRWNHYKVVVGGVVHLYLYARHGDQFQPCGCGKVFSIVV